MRIACVLANDFEDSELTLPMERFRAAGHEVTLIGRKAGEQLKGKRGKAKVETDLGIDDVDDEAFDALFIPGGHSPDQLRADDRFVDLARSFRNRPIFAVCHGPQLLITAGMVEGRTMTAWKTIQGDLRCCGARVVDE